MREASHHILEIPDKLTASFNGKQGKNEIIFKLLKEKKWTKNSIHGKTVL